MSARVSKQQVNNFIRSRRFSELFIQLGWDKKNLPSEPLPVPLLDGKTLSIDRVVEKRGFTVCVCDAGAHYPSTRADRRRLVNQLARHHYEHLLIICGEGRQCWTVAIRPQNRALRTVEVEWNETQDVQPLMEKLDGIVFEISEEDRLSITDVVDRVRNVFMENAESVTRKFYEKFRKELSEFSEFIEGIKEQVSREWYAALMLNRLMFIYFIQKKRFLDDDVDYLETRLKTTQETYGTDTFHNRFYRHFLRHLFSEGLGTPESKRDPALRTMLGKVPYLNGGLFDIHEIEKEHADIDIKDQAFENLFKFFNQYNWHLDSRPTATGKDINPDVIGYIFEKYINDRAKMGAYYTQEDVTGYIARNTIIPFLLNHAKEKCKNAFDAEHGIWRFLRKKPDDYIYDAAKKGCELPDEEIPEHIHRGMDTEAPDLIERRKDWNTKADEQFALPTEIWRETMARRKRHAELQAKLQNSEMCEIDDLITCNLDVERFTADALRWYEGSDFIDAFYSAIAGRQALKSNERSRRGLTLLDPACGSGAFLFAALNILEPLYEVCVDRMEGFVQEDDERLQKTKGQEKYRQFRAVLQEINKHPNRKYWIYKTIILNNLYGVDLMKEAAEITKLRLFLKLAAEAEYDPKKNNLGLEPLPDIDFNVRSGNSLVGFASMKQFEQAVSIEEKPLNQKESPDAHQRRMDYGDLTDEIREQASEVQKANEAFREAQDVGGDEYRQAKDELSRRLAQLNEKMNRYLAEQYGKNNDGYTEWLESHQPFHWMTEFYGIIEEDGGFDVIIGNPPYVEYNEVKEIYKIKDYQTEPCGNLYAFFMERFFRLLNSEQRYGVIVPISSVSTPRMLPLMRLLIDNSSIHISNFAVRPAKLFVGVDMNLSVLIGTPHAKEKKGRISTTSYYRWNEFARKFLFGTILYIEAAFYESCAATPKIGLKIDGDILGKLMKYKPLARLRTKGSRNLIYYHSGGRYFRKCIRKKLSNEYKELSLTNKAEDSILCLLSSSLYYWLWLIFSDCYHVTRADIDAIPVPDSMILDKRFHQLSNVLIDDLEKNAELRVRRRADGSEQQEVNYFVGKSKCLIDEIDKVLSDHYGFTEEELDYIINYDIKYRMGLDA